MLLSFDELLKFVLMQGCGGILAQDRAQTRREVVAQMHLHF